MKAARILILLFVVVCDALAGGQIKELASAKVNPDTNRIIFLNKQAYELFRQNLYDSCLINASLALKLSDSFLQIGEMENDKDNLSRAKYFKAMSLKNIALGMHNKQTVQTLDTLKTALKLMQETGNLEEQASIYKVTGLIYENQNQYESAMDNYHKSLEIYTETGNLRDQADQLLSMSITLRYKGNYGDAMEYVMKALKISREINDSTNMAEALLAMGFTYMFVEKWDDALNAQQEALDIYRKIGDSVEIARIYNDMGATNMGAGKLQVALEQHRKALNIRLKTTDYFYTSASYSYIGNIYVKLNMLPEAITSYKSALEFAKKDGSINNIIITYLDLGSAYQKNSQPEKALEQFMSVLGLNPENRFLTAEVKASMNIARIYLSLNQPHKALIWLKKAEQTAPKSLLLYLEDIYHDIAETYFKLGDYENAYVNMLKYNQVKDSLIVTENLEKITALTNRLEFENKQALQNETHGKTLALKQAQINREKVTRNFSLFGMTGAIVFIIILSIRFIEKKRLNNKLNETLGNLKSMQSQLIHSEKMASLGELTAGIAHEIQNPLNFVNNFSEVSVELMIEMKAEIEKGNIQSAVVISGDLSQNLERIKQHGNRASHIVKGMLEHSRTQAGQKELTDINNLASEYLRIAYFGLKARDKEFNASFRTNLDENLGKIPVVPQDIGRVFLNLINNAFYSVTEKASRIRNGYIPLVTVQTKKREDTAEISIKDNGNGIPPRLMDKIFQPFFTTKPSGKGTGLGLSLSHDIITVGHRGELKVISSEGDGAEFTITIPLK